MWSGNLLGGVSRNNGAIFKKNMFYFGGVRKNLSSLTLYSWHEHVDTGKKLKKIHGSNSDRTVEKLRIRHSIIVVDIVSCRLFKSWFSSL